MHVVAGTILPLGQPVQYAAQSAAAPIELRIYRGANGQFTLYDDAGDGQGWRRGEHATIALTLDDQASVLTIGAREGRYPGMAPSRRFRIVEVDEDNGIGLAKGYGTSIDYTGHKVSVPLGSKR